MGGALFRDCCGVQPHVPPHRDWDSQADRVRRQEHVAHEAAQHPHWGHLPGRPEHGQPVLLQVSLAPELPPQALLDLHDALRPSVRRLYHPPRRLRCCGSRPRRRGLRHDLLDRLDPGHPHVLPHRLLRGRQGGAASLQHRGELLEDLVFPGRPRRAGGLGLRARPDEHELGGVPPGRTLLPDPPDPPALAHRQGEADPRSHRGQSQLERLVSGPRCGEAGIWLRCHRALHYVLLVRSRHEQRQRLAQLRRRGGLQRHPLLVLCSLEMDIGSGQRAHGHGRAAEHDREDVHLRGGGRPGHHTDGCVHQQYHCGHDGAGLDRRGAKEEAAPHE
mmetsp:Transcript_64869/g.200908  ORF Transcript_64869/g.200908 Transcript_64869/m.200908 type:complete len:332 (+) Transcript_64869:653-1648(+)